VIPFDKPSRHRKVRLDDLLEYRRRQRSQAELALADMVADTERLGLYDTDLAEVRAALKAARRASEDLPGVFSALLDTCVLVPHLAAAKSGRRPKTPGRPCDADVLAHDHAGIAVQPTW
jgi:hypothetical protein